MWVRGGLGSRAFALFLLFFVVTALGRPNADRFREKYDNYLKGEAVELDAPMLRSFDYLFFAGFAGAKFKPLALIGDGYFDNFRKEVRRQGVAKDQVPATFYPPSSKSSAENARDFYYDVLSQRVATHHRKLVLFAHSKGAIELFTFAVLHPEFVREHVQAMIFISGAFHGSSLANLVKGEMNRPVSRSLHFTARTVAGIMRPYLNYFWSEGLQSLTTRASESHLREILENSDDSLKQVLERSLFIQTQTSGLDRSPLIWLPDAYLRSEGREASDGLVTLSGQLPLESDEMESVELSGVSHFVPCPRLVSWHYFSRVPRALALGALASL